MCYRQNKNRLYTGNNQGMIGHTFRRRIMRNPMNKKDNV